MTDSGLFPVSLDEYRAALDKQGTKVASAASRLRNERQILKDRVVAALSAGMSESEAARLTGITRKTVREWSGKKT